MGLLHSPINILSAFFQTSIQKVNSIIARVKRPSETEAKALASLFPSSTRKRPNQPSFDPTAECVALSQQKKKKRASKGKPSTVRVVLLKSFTKVVPKGKRRQLLLSKGRVKPVKFLRSMGYLEVKDAIFCAFQEFNLSSFVVLDTTESGHHLTKAKEQDINGDVAIKKRGCLYLCEKYEVLKNSYMYYMTAHT